MRSLDDGTTASCDTGSRSNEKPAGWRQQSAGESETRRFSHNGTWNMGFCNVEDSFLALQRSEANHDSSPSWSTTPPPWRSLLIDITSSGQASSFLPLLGANSPANSNAHGALQLSPMLHATESPVPALRSFPTRPLKYCLVPPFLCPSISLQQPSSTQLAASTVLVFGRPLT